MKKERKKLSSLLFFFCANFAEIKHRKQSVGRRKKKIWMERKLTLARENKREILRRKVRKIVQWRSMNLIQFVLRAGWRWREFAVKIFQWIWLRQHFSSRSYNTLWKQDEKESEKKVSFIAFNKTWSEFNFSFLPHPASQRAAAHSSFAVSIRFCAACSVLRLPLFSTHRSSSSSTILLFLIHSTHKTTF